MHVYPEAMRFSIITYLSLLSHSPPRRGYVAMNEKQVPLQGGTTQIIPRHGYDTVNKFHCDCLKAANVLN